MTEKRETERLKSIGKAKPMRSRGFLSHGTVMPASKSEEQTAANVDTTHHRSRGSRQVSSAANGKPTVLSDTLKVKPYKLEAK